MTGALDGCCPLCSHVLAAALCIKSSRQFNAPFPLTNSNVILFSPSLPRGVLLLTRYPPAWYLIIVLFDTPIPLLKSP